ncbi:MAG: RlmE family RNA methyltransferase [Alphaproteobacteria bacterium]|nr:RlmE family RNA methyltransferase [Alphaproteobacteria bacterium]
MVNKKSSSGLSIRMKHTKVKTARGRKTSSTRWLQRQLNDPYVIKAKKEGYKSRAAFKLIELDDRHHFLKSGKKVVDLGAAPGGWTQVAVERTKTSVVALDILPMDDITGAVTIQCDFMDNEAPDLLKEAADGSVDIVLSDLAANTTGHQATDHLRIMNLVEAAYEFAVEVLNPNGVFIAKVFQGGTERTLLTKMRKDFTKVFHSKPPASRKESPETYVVAMGFKNNN